MLDRGDEGGWMVMSDNGGVVQLTPPHFPREVIPGPLPDRVHSLVGRGIVVVV